MISWWRRQSSMQRRSQSGTRKLGWFWFLSKNMFRGFVEDNPGGTLDKRKMMDMYSSVLSIAKATMFVDQIFKKFDADNDGSIDFKVGQPVKLHNYTTMKILW